MSIDPRQLRDTAGQFVTGVTVVVAEVEGEVRAMTANSFTSLSLDPPLVLVCVAKRTRMGQRIHDVSGFSINILRREQRDVCVYFAGRWTQPDPPPFTFSPWVGAPRLDDCAAALGCRVHQIHEGGDHWIVIGRVDALDRCTDVCQPLAFCGGRYVDVDMAVAPVA